MEGIHTHFLWIDWVVLFAYLALTTWIGHRLRGSQATMKDFFLAGRSLPWPAVTGSIVATEISAITFVGVPGMVFAAGGDFTYLQWGIGSIMARVIVGIWFVKVFYERGIFSPYDYMQQRLGPGARPRFLRRARQTGPDFGDEIFNDPPGQIALKRPLA